jgi:hypothetical protein
MVRAAVRFVVSNDVAAELRGYVVGEDATGAGPVSGAMCPAGPKCKDCDPGATEEHPPERICEHDVVPCTTCRPPASSEPSTAEDAATVGLGVSRTWVDENGPHTERINPDVITQAPSTAEALATVREGLDTLGRCATNDTERFDHTAALGAHALLGRRMGAQDKALRGCRAHLKCTPGCACDVCAALTDAPAVFTLEEVDRALRVPSGRLGSCVEMLALEEFRERLTALRK